MKQNIDRELYLAVPSRAYYAVFQTELGAILLENEVLRLLVYDYEQEEIVEWIPD